MQPSRDLIDRAAHGEPEAREALTAACRPVALRTARALLADADEAEDVAQDTMLRLYDALPGFRGESSVTSWVYRVARNLALDEIRRTRRRRAAAQRTDAARSQRTEPTADADIDRARAAEHVRQAMLRLPPDHREILRLRYSAGRSYDEIGRELDLPPGTVASRIYRALRKLGSDIEPKHLEIVR